MPSTILSDNGVTSGTSGIKTTGANDGQLALQTTTAGGAATTALSISNTQVVTLANALPVGSGGTGATTLAGANLAVTNAANTFNGTQTVQAAATQDAVKIAGRAGGTNSYASTITPTTLAANRTVTLPDADINFTTGLGVANGGTGATTLTANNVILGNGTSAVQFVAPGTTGNLLTSNGTTWTSAAAPSGYAGPRATTFTGNGTFTIPTGITQIKVTVVGGGGGGGGTGTSGGSDGGTGGNSTVASGTQTITTITGVGGGGGLKALNGTGGNAWNAGGAGGIPTNGDLNLKGSGGGDAAGGSSTLGGGGAFKGTPGAGNAGGNYGGGGGGSVFQSGCSTNYGFGGGGGGGGTAIKWLTGLTPGNTLAITIGGAGSAGGGGSGGFAAGTGAGGVVIIEY